MPQKLHNYTVYVTAEYDIEVEATNQVEAETQVRRIVEGAGLDSPLLGGASVHIRAVGHDEWGV